MIPKTTTSSIFTSIQDGILLYQGGLNSLIADSFAKFQKILIYFIPLKKINKRKNYLQNL